MGAKTAVDDDDGDDGEDDEDDDDGGGKGKEARSNPFPLLCAFFLPKICLFFSRKSRSF
jgi:hypothetical protein